MLSPPPEILGANEQLIITSFHCNNRPSPAHFQGECFHGRWGGRETGLVFLLAVQLNWLEEPHCLFPCHLCQPGWVLLGSLR